MCGGWWWWCVGDVGMMMMLVVYVHVCTCACMAVHVGRGARGGPGPHRPRALRACACEHAANRRRPIRANTAGGNQASPHATFSDMKTQKQCRARGGISIGASRDRHHAAPNRPRANLKGPAAGIRRFGDNGEFPETKLRNAEWQWGYLGTCKLAFRIGPRLIQSQQAQPLRSMAVFMAYIYGHEYEA